MIEYKKLDVVGRVIYVTVVLYILTQLWRLLVLLMQWSGLDWGDLLALHSDLSKFLATPWTLVTYMFCHANIGEDLFHIIFNMLWLWWFGRFFLMRHNARQFLTFYLVSGVTAGLFFLLCLNIFPYFIGHNTALVGASGAVCALITVVGITLGEMEMGLNLFVRIVNVRMKWLCVFVLATLLLTTPATNAGGTVCHLGGILFGAVYALSELRGNDLCRWALRLYDWVNGLLHPARMKATRGGGQAPINADRKRDMDYNQRQREHQDRIDAILDKINKTGYNGLTEEEKKTLFDASQRNRKS